MISGVTFLLTWFDGIRKHSVVIIKQQLPKWQRHQQPEARKRQRSQRRRQAPAARDAQRESSHTPLTSTECSSRFTQAPASPKEACPSWTRSSTTSSTDSPPKRPSCPDTTKSQLFPQERSRLQSASSFQESSRSTLCLRAPKPWPSSHPHPLKSANKWAVRQLHKTKRCFLTPPHYG